MKSNPSVASKFFAGLTLVASLTIPAFAQGDTPLPSTVLRVAGHARCSVDGGKQWKLLKAGDIIYAGSMVQTAQGSDLDLLLGEQVKAPAKNSTYNPDAFPGHFISLSADAVLKLDKVTRKASSADQEILLELRTGTVNGNVKKLSGSSNYEIGFAGGIAGMREAIYQLSSGGQLNVMKGKAFVAMNNNPDVKVVEAGSELAPKTVVPATAAAPHPQSQSPQPIVAPAPIHTQPAATSAAPTKETTAQRVPLPRSGLRRAAP